MSLLDSMKRERGINQTKMGRQEVITTSSQSKR
jgi:hypothetical protein